MDRPIKNIQAWTNEDGSRFVVGKLYVPWRGTNGEKITFRTEWDVRKGKLVYYSIEGSSFLLLEIRQTEHPEYQRRRLSFLCPDGKIGWCNGDSYVANSLTKAHV